MIRTLLLSFIFLIICASQCLAVDYFINPSGGNDKARGTSAEMAWQTANLLQKTGFNPGDRILIHAGDTLRQSLLFENVQGSSSAPFTIGRYGEGNDPVIIGKDSDHAIYFLNPAFVIIEHLQIQNPSGKNGIFMEGENAGELKGITIQNVELTAVYDASWEITEPSKIRGGIVFEITKAEKPSWFNGVNILNNHIHDLGSCGITVGSDYKVVKDNEGGDDRYPNLEVRIAHNKIHDIVRDGAIIRQCKGGVMEHNEVWRTGLVAISNGMWWYDSDSCVIQYN